MKSMPRSLFLLLVLLSLQGCRILLFGGTFGENSHLERAEELSRAQRYEDAIAEYRKHIAYRLSIRQRPTWENPYFYLLIIGDIERNQGHLTQALESYEEAESKEVDHYLISDRYRSAASFLEQEGNYQGAIDLLTKYRDRDPLLFDAMRDRLAKEMTRREEAAQPSPSLATK